MCNFCNYSLIQCQCAYDVYVGVCVCMWVCAQWVPRPSRGLLPTEIDAVVAEWAAKAQHLLDLPKLNPADALAWQRDAAKAGAPLSREIAEVAALARCLREAGLIDAEALPGGGSTTALAAALAHAARPEGAVGQLQARIANLTETVRDRLTDDMHATFNLSLRAARAAGETAGTGLESLSRAMVANLRFATAVAGVASENMVRGGGRLFLELGRRLERSQAVLAEIGLVLDQPPARIEAGLRLVLELCDSVITYRSRYLAVLQPAPVLDLVLADPSNPRGLAFQISAIQAALAEVSGLTEDPLVDEAGALSRDAEALVQSILASPEQAVAAAMLPPQLSEMADRLGGLSDGVTRRYFAMLPVARSLGLDGPVAVPAEVLAT